MKSIQVDDKIWEGLVKLKLKLRMKTIPATIQYLLTVYGDAE